MSEGNEKQIVDCKYCDSTGKIHEPNRMGNLELSGSYKKPCPVCHGSGHLRI